MGEEEADEEGEREKIVKVNLTFRISVIGEQNEELIYADLIWHYRSDRPPAATLAHARAEVRRLSSQDAE